MKTELKCELKTAGAQEVGGLCQSLESLERAWPTLWFRPLASRLWKNKLPFEIPVCGPLSQPQEMSMASQSGNLVVAQNSSKGTLPASMRADSQDETLSLKSGSLSQTSPAPEGG